jgi:hypothetical protein
VFKIRRAVTLLAYPFQDDSDVVGVSKIEGLKGQRYLIDLGPGSKGSSSQRDLESS